MKRHTLTILMLLSFCAYGQAAHVSPQQARIAAESFLVKRFPAAPPAKVQTQTPAGSSAIGIQGIEPLEADKELVGYVAHLAPQGYILLSTDDEAPPVKLYSDTGTIGALPPGFRAVIETEMLEDLANLSRAKTNSTANTSSTSQYSSQWNELLQPSVANMAMAEPPALAPNTPLPTTAWDQGDPYNYYAPAASGGPGGRAWAGCGATALAQILRYHSFPPAVTSDHTYVDSSGACQGTHSISDAGVGAYDWANMPALISTSSPEAQKRAVGQLIYHCGVALASDYEADSTATYLEDVPNALQTHFGHAVQGYFYKSSYIDTQWYAKIESDIDNDKPIFYGMWQADWSAGHFVVCDGYRNGNEIHLNLGWGGAWTAWYNMDSVVISGNYTWTNHIAVFGITPTSPVLTVNSSGASSVSITSSTGHGGTTDYTKTVTWGTSVTLTAPSMANGEPFTGWTGDVTSSDPAISFSVTGNTVVTANYEMLTLTVNSSGASSVVIASATGHGGTTNYARAVASGTNVMLTAPSTAGRMTFIGWTGDITSSSRIILCNLTGSMTVTANYAYTLTVYSSVASSVSITSSTGHGGNTRYTKSVPVGDIVTLTAPSTISGMTFTGWTGDVTSSNQTISFAMNDNQSVTANYTSIFTLIVNSSGASAVSITSDTGHEGTTNYARAVVSGTSVWLTAPSTAGEMTFGGWTGAVTSSNQTIWLGINSNKSVTANYTFITSHPQPLAQTICSGDSVQYCVTAAGPSPLFYQWQKDGTDIPGATSSCYTATVAGSYRCVVSDAHWSSTSNSAELTVASKAVSPLPADGLSGVSTTVHVSWSNGGVATSYDVYFGTGSSLGLSDRKVSGTTSTTYAPGILEYGRTYYWRIDSTNMCGNSAGDVWSFTTSTELGQIMEGHIATSAGVTVTYVTLTTSDGHSYSNGNGEFVFLVPYGWSGTVTPSRSGYYFIPASRSYDNVTTSQLGQDYIAELIPVVIESVVPSSGPAGTVVTLGGTYFGDTQGRVLFGGTPAAILEWTSTFVTCIVPTGAVTGNVVVEKSDSRLSNGMTFTVTRADILYVNNTADENFQYGTRQYPFKTIAGAITAAVDGTAIEVDDGVYTGPENRGLDTLGKAITVRSASGHASCIIDCNGLGKGFYIHDGEDANSVIEGFSIIKGSDGGESATVFGGGIAIIGSSPTIRNCIISDSHGMAAIYIENGSPLIEGCIIRGSDLPTGIGAVVDVGGSPTLHNCMITGNSGMMGGIYAQNSNLTVVNCAIASNVGAADMAGGITSDFSSVNVLNTILWGNSPCQLLAFDSTLTVGHSCVQGGYSGTGNISADPLFADPANGDYHLKSEYGRWDITARLWVTDTATSPCIDAGDPVSPWQAELWPHGGRVNMGAYGGTPEASMSPNTTGSIAEMNHDGVVDFSDYAILARQWMLDNTFVGVPMPSDVNRDGQVDFGDLCEFTQHWLDGR